MPLCVGCDSADPCENTISQTLTSPDGTQKAVVFTRGCGATTGDSTQISLVNSSGSVGKEAGNVLVLGDETPVSLRWKNATTLEIHFPATSQSFTKKTSVDGVSVVYN